MIKIIVFIDNLERLNFFERIKLKDVNKYRYIFITNKYSVYKNSLTKCYLLKTKKYAAKYTSNRFYRIDSLDYKLGNLSKKCYENLYRSIFYTLDLILKKYEDKKTVFFLWNGSRSHDAAIKNFAELRKIRIIYFEQPNIKGKIILDGKGINANSSIPHIDRTPTKSSVDFNFWKNEFIKKELKKQSVPQADYKTNIIKFDLLRFYDFLFAFLLRIPPSSKTKLFFKIKHRIERKKSKYESISLSESPSFIKDFIFHPLQIESDSQIQLNAKITREDAILKTLEVAQKRNIPNVIIKAHPADVNYPNFDKVNFEAKRLKINLYKSKENTIELIKRSNLITIINSNIGFLSILLNKEVIFFGESQFRDFTLNDCNWYVNDYLLNIDYFDSNEIPKKNIQNLYNKINKIIK